MKHSPVIIAGGGPVGMTLALELALHGVPCQLFERAPSTTRHPKMDITNGRSMELFKRLGVADALRAAAVPAHHPLDVAWVTSMTDRELYRFRYPSPTLARERYDARNDGRQPAEPAMRVSQVVIEPILQRRVLDEPLIDARWGVEVSGYCEDDDGVTVHTRARGRGETERFRASYLAACDGGNSTVRQAAGIGLGGKQNLANRFMIHFRSQARDQLARFGIAWHYQRPTGTLIAQNDRDVWTLHARLPEGSDPSQVDPRRVLFDWLGTEIPVDILVANPWSPHLLVADHYRRGRVFLAGDAAHQYIPTGGYGMNTGIGDAVGLGWQLAAYLRGWGGAGLLDAYQTERRPVGLANRGWSEHHTEVRLEIAKAYAEAGLASARAPASGALRPDALTQLSTRIATLGNAENECLGVEFAYRYAESELVAQTLPAGAGSQAPAADPLDIPDTAWPGMRIPHLRLAEGDSIHQRLNRRGLTLLRFDPRRNTAPAENQAQLRGIPLTVVDVDSPKARDLYGADLALVRPDQHLAWRGPKADATTIDTATGHPPNV